MAFWNRKKTDSQPGTGEGLDLSRLPRHVGIIMDGNGRWAKKRGLPRTAGHAAGAESFRTIAYYCKDLGIPYLTVYAFSTENWKRPMEEVSAIMDLLQKYLLDSGANYVVVLREDDTIAGIVTKTSVARSVAENLWGEAK